jgi:hypothetical protein
MSQDLTAEEKKILNSNIKYAGELLLQSGDDSWEIYEDANNDDDRVNILMEYSPNAPPERPEGGETPRGLINWRDEETKRAVLKGMDFVSNAVVVDVDRAERHADWTKLKKNKWRVKLKKGGKLNLNFPNTIATTKEMNAEFEAMCPCKKADFEEHDSSFGYTLLTKCATQFNSVSVENVMRLLAAGANPRQKRVEPPRPRGASTRARRGNAASIYPLTPMGLAIRYANVPVVKLLLQYGVKIDEDNGGGDGLKKGGTHYDYVKSAPWSQGQHQEAVYAIQVLFDALAEEKEEGKIIQNFATVEQPKTEAEKNQKAQYVEAKADKIYQKFNEAVLNDAKKQEKKQAEKSLRLRRRALARRMKRNPNFVSVGGSADLPKAFPGIAAFLEYTDEDLGERKKEFNVTHEKWNAAVQAQEDVSMSAQLEKVEKIKGDALERKDILKIALAAERLEVKKRLMERLADRRNEAAAKAAEAAVKDNGGSEGGGRRRRRKRRTKKRRKKHIKKRRKTKKRKRRKSKRRKSKRRKSKRRKSRR